MSAGIHETRTLILSCVATLTKSAVTSNGALADDFDLVAEGVLDSLGFIKLIAELEKRLSIQIDFDAIDSEHVTVLGPLSRYIAALRTR
jgi:acyl carrier protein